MAISEWADMMPNTITVQAKSGVDAYNKPTYATGTSYSARVVYKNKITVDAIGREVTARGVIYVAATGAISPEDKITLPDSSTPQIISVERFPDENGAHHNQVYFL